MGVSKKLTSCNSLPNKNSDLFIYLFIYLLGGGSYVWMSDGLIYHKTPTYLKIIYASPSTGHFCKGYENWVAQELAVHFG